MKIAYLVNQLLRKGADRPYLATHATGLEALAKAVAPFELADAGGLDSFRADLASLLERLELDAGGREAGR